MSKPLKIGYFADGPWSHKAFELINGDEQFEIAFIVPRTDTQDDTLFQYSQKHGIDYLFPVKINSQEFFEKAATYHCDLFVSMSFNQIFRKRIIELPAMATINCHAGKLPFYRGRNILNWALINDEDEFGITVHHIDEGIDTGDIILQNTYPITEVDDYGSLLEKAYDGCAQTLYQALKQIATGKAKRINQKSIHPVGFYCGRRGPGDETIDWTLNSRRVFNFIRAIAAPGPLATTTLNGKLVNIGKALLIKDAPVYINTPGQILAKTEEGFLVKTGDSFIEIRSISSEEKLRVGDKLGT